MTLKNMLDVTLQLCAERIPGKGEDAWCIRFGDRSGMIGVFDGCGGLGAATYESLGGCTGAYLAANAVKRAATDWFDACGEVAPGSAEQLRQAMMNWLTAFLERTGNSGTKLIGSMVRPLPTTAAIWTVEKDEQKLRAWSISAGDSRNYLIDLDGLAQVSVDDLPHEDAMSNLYHDAPMTNVISADGRFTLACTAYEFSTPCILISATDGCFGYLKSPMEFEHLLLSTLVCAQNVDQWERALAAKLDEIAGDDQTMVAAIFGYRGFHRLQKEMRRRFDTLDKLVTLMEGDETMRANVWERYKAGYYRYAKGGIPSCE